jgi:hypothetical protein
MGEISYPNQEIHLFETRDLSRNWSFKQADDTAKDAWLPVKRIPSTVHQDLVDNKRCVLWLGYGSVIDDFG